jgi:hypothetical protein
VTTSNAALAVQLVRRHSGVERSDNYFVTRGRPWSAREVDVLKRNRHSKTVDLLALLPGRSKYAISSQRSERGLSYTPLPWTRGEDDEIRVSGKRTGAVGLHRLLPHRTSDQIAKRATEIGVTLFNCHAAPVTIIGEPLADAIRKRAKEDGISMRGLDRELGTSGYFTNVAALRAKRGSAPYMPAIRKAIEFFEAELLTGPDGTNTIDWKDE